MDQGPGTITVNGEPLTLGSAETVAGLIDRLELRGKRLAVEVNGGIVPRSEHHERALHDGDKVEIVHAVGGG